MTKEELTHALVSLLAPVLSALIVAAGGVLAAVLTFGLGRLRTWLDAHGQAAAAKATEAAAARVQAGLENAAGRVALKVQTGEINPADMASIKAAAFIELNGFAEKYADSLAVIKPTAQALLDGVLGKITKATPTVPVLASAPVTEILPYDLVGDKK